MELTINAWPIFSKNYRSKKRIIVNRWGTSSGKTGSLIRLFLLWLISGRVDDEKVFDKGTVSIVRKYGANLRTSVQRDFEWLIAEFWLFEKIEINKANRTYQYQNRTIEFIWIDDPQKARWPRRDILYCNEANELSWEDFFQLSVRTWYKIFIDFNPSDEDVWINTELEQKRAIVDKDVEVIVSTYRDNPFLVSDISKEIERLSIINPEYYKIYWLGEYWRLDGLIFDIEDIDKVPENAKLVCYWQDFWFTNDPTSLIAIYKWNGGIVLDEKIYRTGLTNSDIVSEYKILWINKNDEIFADSSEPKSIEEIFRSGYNIKPVIKWQDSVMFWINLMKEYKIYVTTQSNNLRKEFKKYVWAVDKNGKSMNQPIDAYNHGIDASRYWITMKLKKQLVKEVLLESF